ncbi:D-alanyl-D-alanine carboxypeptidase [Candidatus Dojkabacteria bacterium]|uniref:D-alanyl-D-alanine carboxypeptidase n=1 Tax=Candidatus Dojkabacteria bacterium TaxID=2099670 RepID=A0A955HYE5_9BACT|nr:D-alanyl-D-alanine carboxypeptidase [Candidatus Dojkabacteria bacterium]
MKSEEIVSKKSLLNRPFSPSLTGDFGQGGHWFKVLTNKAQKAAYLIIDQSMRFRSAIWMGVFICAIFVGLYISYLQLGKPRGNPFLAPSNAFNETEFSPILLPPIPFESQKSKLDLKTIDAQAILAFNPLNDQIYISLNSDSELPIASITKLMSSEIIYDKYDLDSEPVLNEKLPKNVEWGVGVKKGDSVKVSEALKAMMIGSYNDLAYLFAQNYPDGGYNGFIEEMNKRARLLGMKSTHFSNPAGLDDSENYSTAEDLMKLSKHFIQNKDLVEIVGTISYKLEIRSSDGVSRVVSTYTTNDLLGSSPYVKGLKTGFTEEAKGCFVGYFVASDSDELVTIILGSEGNRFDETVKLTDEINLAYD